MNTLPSAPLSLNARIRVELLRSVLARCAHVDWEFLRVPRDGVIVRATHQFSPSCRACLRVDGDSWVFEATPGRFLSYEREIIEHAWVVEAFCRWADAAQLEVDAAAEIDDLKVQDGYWRCPKCDTERFGGRYGSQTSCCGDARRSMTRLRPVPPPAETTGSTVVTMACSGS